MKINKIIVLLCCLILAASFVSAVDVSVKCTPDTPVKTGEFVTCDLMVPTELTLGTVDFTVAIDEGVGNYEVDSVSGDAGVLPIFNKKLGLYTSIAPNVKTKILGKIKFKALGKDGDAATFSVSKLLVKDSNQKSVVVTLGEFPDLKVGEGVIPGSEQKCGNKVVEGNEECDGSVPAGKTCETVVAKGWTGTLLCSSQCAIVDDGCKASGAATPQKVFIDGVTEDTNKQTATENKLNFISLLAGKLKTFFTAMNW
jgi:hypothetical protein